MSLGINFVSYT